MSYVLDYELQNKLAIANVQNIHLIFKFLKREHSMAYINIYKLYSETNFIF